MCVGGCVCVSYQASVRGRCSVVLSVCLCVCVSYQASVRGRCSVVLSVCLCVSYQASDYPARRYYFQGNKTMVTYHQWRIQELCSGGGSTNSVEDRGQRERGSGGGSPVVRGSVGSCNFMQEISFHIVKFS